MVTRKETRDNKREGNKDESQTDRNDETTYTHKPPIHPCQSAPPM